MKCNECRFSDSNLCCTATRKTRKSIDCEGVYKESGAAEKNRCPQHTPSRHYGRKKSLKHATGIARTISREKYEQECIFYKNLRKK